MDTGDLAPGTQVGKYRIVDTLGVGGSATVYRAQMQGMRQMVALKLMHDGHPEGDTERQRFAREAEVLRKLQHPHIVGLKDYGHAFDGRPYLVFALLEGRSLRDRLQQMGPMPLAEVGRVSIQVLRALEKAHGHGIAHRDIKPDNIFLSRGVLGEMAQVLDFGLAKAAMSFDGGVTKAGAVLGTPRYIAPEQARGEQVSFPADVYSFGLVMAEMITGQPVVKGHDDVQIYIQQGSDRPLDLDLAIRQSVFGSIIQRAVAKDPSVRYRQASQMLADVRVANEHLGAALAPMNEAELEATQMIDPSTAMQLSAPTEMSEKLRAAFNKAAFKNGPAPATPAPHRPASPAAPYAEPEPAIPAPPPSAPVPLVTTRADPPEPPHHAPAAPPARAPLLTPTPPPVSGPPVAPSISPPAVPSRTTTTGRLLAVVVVLLVLLVGAALLLWRSRA